MEKLSQKDIRALKIGAVGVAAVLMFLFALEWRDRWVTAREKGAQVRAKLDVIDVDKAKRAGLMSIVPVFEMPVEKEKQKFLFRDKLSEQLRSARINSEPLQEATGGKSPYPGYKLLNLKCSAKCQFGQVLDLLARLKENPYLVGIEELRVRSDRRDPRQVELNMTVSTLVK
jgi:hypothetical protein